jgi:putative ABC transport system permease protein
MLVKNAGATSLVVLSLALGIGANTTIFSVVNSLQFRPPSVEQPSRLLDVWLHNEKESGAFSGYSPLNFPDFAYYREHNSVFSGLTAEAGDGTTLIWSRDGQGEAIHGMLVSSNFFSVLGVTPQLGRAFLPEEDTPGGAQPVAMVSHAFWQQRLGGDTSLSKRIMLNGRAYTVVGVVPASFHGVLIGSAPDVWVPLSMQPAVTPGADLTSRSYNWLNVYGRLKPGITRLQAQADLLVLSQQLARSYPDSNKDIEALAYAATLVPGPFRGFLSMITAALMAVVGLVLLIGCANAANLLLAQASGRSREMSVRSALGASRWRLLRQSLTESVLLGCFGGLAGLLLASMAAPLLLRLKPTNIPVSLQIPVDGRVLVFTLAVSVLTGVIFGLAPALRASRLDLASSLKDGTPSSGQRRSRLRSALVTAQVAVCLVLLIGAGLCLRSLSNAQSIDPGFDVNNALVASLDVDTFGYNEARGRDLYRDLLDRVAELPGVRAGSLSEMLPLGTAERTEGVTIEGSPALGLGESGPAAVDDVSVAPNYFRTMGIPLLEGRDFTARDIQGAPRVVIINDVMAARFWPHQNPIGRHVIMGGPEDPAARQVCEVIGVAKAGKYRTLGEDPQPFMYKPYWQNYVPRVRLIVRTEGDTDAVLSGLRRAVQQLDPNLALYDIETLKQLMVLQLFPAHATALLLGVFGGLALLLAMAGLYGVMSYLVAERTHEVGIRMALGAHARDVLKLVVGNGMRLALVGVVLGLAGAFAITRLLSSLLYGIQPTDFLTFSGVSVMLAGVAFLASYFPARRATKVDPMVALRRE